MPNILILTDETADDYFEDYENAFEMLGNALVQATCDALGLKTSDVVVMELAMNRSINAPNIQVFCVASYTDERLDHLEEWRDRMIVACSVTADDQLCSFLKELKIEVWPIMPSGSWGAVPLFGRMPN